MAHSHPIFRSTRLVCLLAASQMALSAAVDAPKADAPKTEAPKADAPKADAPKVDAPKVDAPKVDAPKVDAPKAEAPRVVFQNGSSIPLTSLTLQGDRLVVKTADEAFSVGKMFPLATADHVYGDKPAALNQGVALLLMGNPKEAQKLLEPIVTEHRVTAKISGNYWLEAARAQLVVLAINGDTAECTALGKEISDATPAQGIDPFVTLGKALLLPAETKVDDRLLALRDLTIDSQPPDVRAYASFYIGNLCKKEKRMAEALEAYLTVSCVTPTGGMVLNAAAEIQAAEVIIALGRADEPKELLNGRRDQAIILLNAAVRDAPGTILVDEAHKRLESLK
jgi:tetratricopeptide (TPR) repeat protein